MALLSAGFWSGSPARASRSPNQKLNLGIVGVANRGETNLIGVHHETISALCDVDEDYLEQRNARYPGAKRFRDFRELLDFPHLDGVMISSPDHTHAHAALMAIQRGLHVYCEKPLAHSISEVRRLARAAKKSPVITQTGVQHHTTPGYRRVAELIRSGVIGEVREVHSWTSRPYWPQAVAQRPAAEAIPPQLDWDLWLGPAPARPYASGYHPTNWRGFWDFGTGALGDRGPHQLDPAFYALELTSPERIEAESSGVTEESPPEWAIVRFEFPARGNRPAVRVTWYDGGKQPSREITGVKQRLPDNGTLFIGSLARLFAPELGGNPLVIPNQSGAELPPATVQLPVSKGHYQEWLDACKGEGTVQCDFQYGALLTETCLLGNVALRAGKAIQWNGESGEIVGNPEARRYLTRPYRQGWEL